jgi:hypothetical protein
VASTHLDPTLQAALAADSPLVFYALELLLPSGPVRLLDGSGQITLFGNTFVGADPAWGAMMAMDAMQDGVATEAPHLVAHIQVPSLTAATFMANANTQGSQVTAWMGALNRVTGQPQGQPYTIFLGYVSTAALLVDKNSRVVKFDVESLWDRFFDVDEGILLTNSSHQDFWPGELGLEYVTQVQMQIPWGTDLPRPILVHDVPNGSPTYSNGAGSPYVGGFFGGSFTDIGAGIGGLNLGGFL